MIKLTSRDDVFDVLSAYVASIAVGVAMELGLFWLLAEHPMDVASVAQALNIPVNRCRYWLQILSGLGLIELDSTGYKPSPVADTDILNTWSRESWAFLARDECERLASVCDPAFQIQQPNLMTRALRLTTQNYVEKMAEDRERARLFTRMLYELHQPLADRLAELLDLNGIYRLIDLGGGSGVISMALLRRYPELSSTIVDVESVCIAGREIAKENSLSDRIHFHGANLMNDEWPGGYDMALYCDVGVYSEALFRKFWATLNRNGRLVIVDYFAPTEGSAPQERLYWTFLDSLADPDVRVTTVASLQEQLMQAGFQPQYENAVLPCGRIVIQADKRDLLL